MMHKWRLSLVLIVMLIFTMPIHAQNSDDDGYAIALERIQEALDTGATTLNLSWLRLTQVPPEIGQLANLQAIYLSDNQLSTLPAEIGQLINLQEL